MYPKELEFSVETSNCRGNGQIEDEHGLSCESVECDTNDGNCLLVLVAKMKAVEELCSFPFSCVVGMEGEVSGLCVCGCNAVV